MFLKWHNVIYLYCRDKYNYYCNVKLLAQSKNENIDILSNDVIILLAAIQLLVARPYSTRWSEKKWRPILLQQKMIVIYFHIAKPQMVVLYNKWLLESICELFQAVEAW